MGRNKGTISRELRRNSVDSQYMPIVAQHQYQARRAYCKPHNMLEHARLLEHVRHRLLECQWSPKEIAGRLRAEYGKRRKKRSAEEKRGKIQISHDITERRQEPKTAQK